MMQDLRKQIEELKQYILLLFSLKASAGECLWHGCIDELQVLIPRVRCLTKSTHNFASRNRAHHAVNGQVHGTHEHILVRIRRPRHIRLLRDICVAKTERPVRADRIDSTMDKHLFIR